MPIKYLASDVTSNECIAGSGYLPEKSNTGEYMKAWYIIVQYLYEMFANQLLCHRATMHWTDTCVWFICATF